MSSPIIYPEIPSFREALKKAVKRTQLDRAYLKDCVVLSDGRLWVSYRGEQLGVNDWRVFDELVRRVDGRFDSPCTVSCQEVCLALGLTSFEMFKQILIRLRTGVVRIHREKYEAAFNVLSECRWVDGELNYFISAQAAQLLRA